MAHNPVALRFRYSLAYGSDRKCRQKSADASGGNNELRIANFELRI